MSGAPSRLHDWRRGSSLIRSQWLSKRVAVAALLVAEVAVLAFVAWSARTQPTFGVFVRENAASITMADQHNVVHAVTVDRVVSPSAAWLLVQADRNQGTPDGIIGSRWIPAGESEKVTIAVGPRPLPKRIYVTLLADLGKPHALEYGGASGSLTATGAGLASVLSSKGVVGAWHDQGQADHCGWLAGCRSR